MKYFVLQVPTGREEHVRNGLREKCFAAEAPSKVVHLRNRGAWQEVQRVLFPGYVFVGLETLSAEVWHSGDPERPVCLFPRCVQHRRNKPSL